MAESDNQIGIDIENVNRKIDWKSIVLKKFNKTDSHPPSRLDFLTIWTMREAYFKYSQDINYLAISITDIRRNCHWMCEHLDDVIYSICTKSQDDNIKYKILNLSNLYD
jgi:phosphopantetheinyl transferase